MSRNDPTWTARIHADVKEYLQEKKGLSAGECLFRYYKILKENELPDMQQELKEAEARVLHLRGIVTHIEAENDKKNTLVTHKKHTKNR